MDAGILLAGSLYISEQTQLHDRAFVTGLGEMKVVYILFLLYLSCI